MTRIQLSLLFLLVLAVSPVIAVEDREPVSTVPITIRLYNYAEVGATLIDRSRETAGRVLERAGVGVIWLDCSIASSGSGPANPRCNQVGGKRTLAVRVMPARMMPNDLPNGIFGFAMLSASDPHATVANVYNVYFDRIRRISDGRKVRRGVLLGYMMAHEIGHLLLGFNSHSGGGIMRIPWGPRELRRADLIQLGFSAKQSNRMRANVVSRLPKSD